MAKKRKAASTSGTSQPDEQEPVPKFESDSSEEEEEEQISSEEEEEEDDDDEDSQSGSESDSDDNADAESVKRLLEPLSKEQIASLLKEAAERDPSVLSDIIRLADSDPTHRKIFVHGLGWDATADQVQAAFKTYGEIEECKLITDKATGRAKGYAFVLFKSRASAKKALAQPQKQIGNRTTSCQLASLGPAAPAAPDSGARKIYVANVGQNVNAENLRAFFEKFGEIDEGPLGFDELTNKPKGFAIFSYKSAEGCKKALEEPVKVFEGHQLQCKKFIENHKNNSNLTSAKTNNSGYNYGLVQGDVGYGNLDVNPGLLSGATGFLMGQGLGLVANPMLASGLNPMGLNASGLSASVGGIGGSYGINSISPSVMGSYASQLSMQGLGAYQGSQIGQSGVATNAGALPGVGAPKGQSSFGSSGTIFSPHFGR